MPHALTAADQPLGELNTTPLIDVMLVLLVMFILSIPATMHEVPVDLPQGGVIPPDAEILSENFVSLTPAGATSWNGQPVSEAQLVALLRAAALRNPEPLIRFEPQSTAPYGASLRVLNLIRASDPAAFALSGNEKYASFARQSSVPVP